MSRGRSSRTFWVGLTFAAAVLIPQPRGEPPTLVRSISPHLGYHRNIVADARRVAVGRRSAMLPVQQLVAVPSLF